MLVAASRTAQQVRLLQQELAHVAWGMGMNAPALQAVTREGIHQAFVVGTLEHQDQQGPGCSVKKSHLLQKPH